jgi:MFS family permease
LEIAGPPIGGFIVSVASWHYIFLINVPIGIITIIFGMKILPVGHKAVDERLDIKGAVLFSLAVILAFLSLKKGQVVGYNNTWIILGFVFAIVSIILFIWLQKRIKTPLLQLDIFKNQLFSISIFCAFISFVAISCTNIIIKQSTIGRTP